MFHLPTKAEGSDPDPNQSNPINRSPVGEIPLFLRLPEREKKGPNPMASTNPHHQFLLG